MMLVEFLCCNEPIFNDLVLDARRSPWLTTFLCKRCNYRTLRIMKIVSGAMTAGKV